jgi:DNA-binding response OmpR family regulator
MERDISMFFTKKVIKEINRTIVLVDDKSFNLISLKDRLKKNYEAVHTAQSFKTLFETLEEVEAGLIMVDVGMADIGESDIIEMINSEIHAKEIPVLFLTSARDKQSMLKGKNIGAVDFLQKPVSDRDLFDTIEYYVNPEKPDSHKPIILAVDEDPETLKSVNWLLSSEYTVFTLPKSDQIRNILKKITPDLFLLDCSTSAENSGFNLIPVIRKFADHRETPIVYLTSDTSADNVKKAISHGANDFIAKPIDGTLLKEKIEAQLKNHMIIRRVRELNQREKD